MIWNKRLVFRSSIYSIRALDPEFAVFRGENVNKRKPKQRSRMIPVQCGPFAKEILHLFHIYVQNVFVCIWKHTCVQMWSVYVYLYTSYETYTLYFGKGVHFFKWILFPRAVLDLQKNGEKNREFPYTHYPRTAQDSSWWYSICFD